MSDTRLANRILPDAEKTRRFVFVLLENFTMLSFASAVECLRIANRMAGRPAYDWRLIGEDGGRVRCSAGAEFTLDGDLDDLGRDHAVSVEFIQLSRRCRGDDPGEGDLLRFMKPVQVQNYGMVLGEVGV